MLKYVVAGGALLWLIFVYGENHAPQPPAAKESSPPPFSRLGGAASQPGFWKDQARQGTALWTRTLAWCRQEYANRQNPTVSQGICTMVLSVESQLELSHV